MNILQTTELCTLLRYKSHAVVWYVSYTSIKLLFKNFKLIVKKKIQLGNGQRTWTVISLKRIHRWHIWCSNEKRCSLLLAIVLVNVLSRSVCPALCDPTDCSSSGSSVHGTSQARILESVAISSSRGSSRPRDQTRVSRTAGRFLTHWAIREAPSLAIREVPIKTILRSHHTSTGMAKMQNSSSTKCWQGGRENASLTHCWQERKTEPPC